MKYSIITTHSILFLLTFHLLSGNQAAFSTKTTVVENRVVELLLLTFDSVKTFYWAT